MNIRTFPPMDMGRESSTAAMPTRDRLSRLRQQIGQRIGQCVTLRLSDGTERRVVIERLVRSRSIVCVGGLVVDLLDLEGVE